ncbi:hypothetical protein BGW41_005756, partial [Actinomortierella wolfii]
MDCLEELKYFRFIIGNPNVKLNGKDWDYIQESNCKEWGASAGGACNGPCLTRNHRYCMFASDENMAKFKEWCEKDGYIAKAKDCGWDDFQFPTSCGSDTEIPRG